MSEISRSTAPGEAVGVPPRGGVCLSAEGGQAGLVHSQTSQTPGSERLEVDPVKTRLKRMRTGIITAARLHQEECPRYRCCMLTTTYRPDVEWSPDHVSALMDRIRKWLGRRGEKARYAWKLELTKAGREHYHVLLWLPRGLTLPKPDKQGWWPHGMTRIEWVRKAVGYAAKYASKEDEGSFRKGARMYGVGGHTGRFLLERRWWRLPNWLRQGQVGPEDRTRRLVGGGWVSRLTGEVFASPWRVLFKGGRVFIQAIGPLSFYPDQGAPG